MNLAGMTARQDRRRPVADEERMSLVALDDRELAYQRGCFRSSCQRRLPLTALSDNARFLPFLTAGQRAMIPIGPFDQVALFSGSRPTGVAVA
jgi:hypothetical protein